MVACDAGPLIYLSEIEQFHLLRELFGTVAIAPAVKVETVDQATGYACAATVGEALASGWMQVVPAAEASQVMAIRAQLHIGESETLVMAHEQSVEAVLVDDLHARNFARAMGLNVTGTVGVLLLARQRGLTLEIKPILDQMRSLGFRLSETVYQHIVGQLLADADDDLR